MAIRLRIFKQKYVKKGKFIDDYEYPSEGLTQEVLVVKVFKSYVAMADWLDKNKRYAEHVMFASHLPIKTLGGVKRVVFDGVSTWVEGYGNI